MDLNKARELRKELEGIEAAMDRIIEKYGEMPTANDVEDLEGALSQISGRIENIIERAAELPAAEDLRS